MAKYDHGGGCACGLSRFCDCSNATLQDRLDREAYDKMYPKKENKPVALKQMEDLYDSGLSGKNVPPEQRAIGHSGHGTGYPMLDIADKGNLLVSMIANGVRLTQTVPMPAEVAKAVENVLRSAAAIRRDAS